MMNPWELVGWLVFLSYLPIPVSFWGKHFHQWFHVVKERYEARQYERMMDAKFKAAYGISPEDATDEQLTEFSRSQLKTSLAVAMFDIGQALKPIGRALTDAKAGEMADVILGDDGHQVTRLAADGGVEIIQPLPKGPLAESIDIIADALNRWDLGERPPEGLPAHWNRLVVYIREHQEPDLEELDPLPF